MDLCNERDIKALLERHGFRFFKSMGQNFLLDGGIPDALVTHAGPTEQNGVLEIGPGIGPLTVRLADVAAKVVTIELDQSLRPILTETLAGRDNVEVIYGDALAMNLPALVDEKFHGLTPMCCANLPYNITTPVLTALIDAHRFERITVMLQREAAARICAAPGEGDYGQFSIYCQYYCDTKILFEVPPESFLPAPKVTSAVMEFLPRSAPPADVPDPAFFFRVVKAAFAQRRKTLLNALSAGMGGLDKENIRAAIAACGLSETVRGERLGIPEFAALSRALAASR